jgi:hypothetical protein
MGAHTQLQRGVHTVALIADNGSTHAPKQLRDGWTSNFNGPAPSKSVTQPPSRRLANRLKSFGAYGVSTDFFLKSLSSRREGEQLLCVLVKRGLRPSERRYTRLSSPRHSKAFNQS